MSASSPSTSPSALAIESGRRLLVTAANPFLTGASLLFLDALSILAGTLLGVYVWGLVNPAISLAHYFHLGIPLALCCSAYFAFDLYAPAAFGPVEELRRIVLATALVSLVLTAEVFLTKEVGTYSRGAFLMSGALISILVPLGRSALRSACASRAWWGTSVLILGAGTTGRLLLKKLQAEPGLGLKPVACLDDDPQKHGECEGIPVPGPLCMAPDLAKELNVRHLMVAMPSVKREKLISTLERHGAPFARIIVIPNLFGMASLWVSTHDMGGVLGLEVRQNLLVPLNRALKRTIDLALAVILGLLAIPVFAIAAIWIKRVSPGPVFYSQIRGGVAGKKLRIWKLRTMYPDAQALLDEHLESSVAARDEWRRYCKLKEDPRILPGVGHLLRRTSLDELPQLWNVLRGEMSLVGPRPFPEYHLERFDPDFRAFRAKVRPGLTGLWQVSARSDGDLESQLELDSYYIRNWSLWLELHILARTVSVVLRGQGAY